MPVAERASSEASEAIGDLIEIAKMDYDEVVDTEEDEAAFAKAMDETNNRLTSISFLICSISPSLS